MKEQIEQIVNKTYLSDKEKKHLTSELLDLFAVVVPKGTLCSEMCCPNEAVSVVNVEKWYRCKDH